MSKVTHIIICVVLGIGGMLLGRYLYRVSHDDAVQEIENRYGTPRKEWTREPSPAPSSYNLPPVLLKYDSSALEDSENFTHDE